MSASTRRLRLSVGLGVLALLGVPGCRQMHQRYVLYPNGDGRRLADVPTEETGRVRAPADDRRAEDVRGGKDIPLMRIGR